jgi:TolB-like protein/DNA-binding winged helix-turn-helix (wHTH) protein/Tfp pilus assembly protein PilF
VSSEFHLGPWLVQPGQSTISGNGKTTRLEPKIVAVLVCLAEHTGETVSKEQLLRRVWGDTFVTDDVLTRCISELRKVLEDDPKEPKVIQTIPRKGYRLVPQVRPVKKRTLRPYLIGSLVLLATLTMAMAYRRLRNHPSSIHSLAVLPLKNLSGDPTQEYLADGMTEALIGSLSKIRDLRVISRTSAMHFKDTQLSLPEIASALRVDAIVEGSVIREGNRIRVSAQLIRGATDDHFWSETYDRDLRDVLALESEVAQSIAAKVEVTVTGPEHEMLTAVRSVSPEVYENYLRGQFALDRGNSRAEFEESIGYFEEAIKRDSKFAPAYVGLANAYSELSTIFIGAAPETVRPKAMTAIRKALELDPESVDAHLLLADMERSQWQWAEAEAEYRRVLGLSPNNADAQAGLSAWLLSQGRTEEALAVARRGRELDPFVVSGTYIGWILFSAHRYDEALRELHSVLAVRPDDVPALWNLGYALIANGQPEKAIPVLEKAVSLSDRPGVIGVLIRAYAHAGRRADALRLLAELKRRKQAGYVPAGAFVNAYLGLGENDQALAWLEQAYTEHSNLLQSIKVHPFFDPIRQDPRFKGLVRRIGLD